MTYSDLLQEGIYLMLTGISFVMLFLLILIYAIVAMSKIINYLFPEKPLSPLSDNAPSTINDRSDLTDLRPVIVAAIAHHRRQQP